MAGFQQNRYQPKTGTNTSGNAKTGAVASNTAVTGTGTKREALFRTGLFKPKTEGGATLASVLLKEAVTIPAGSYINLYFNEDKKSEQSPDYSLVVMEATAK